jgi:hypothetical protein
MTSPTVTPFLTLAAFTAMWDGAPLTTQQNAITTLALQVTSFWIYRNGPQGSNLPADNPSAQFVVWDVVSNAVRYQKFSKLSSYSKITAHRQDAGTFADVMKALEFTDVHKQLLDIPLEALPMSSCRPNDFDAPDQDQGWPTRWSDAFGNLGWDWWEPNND